MTSLLSGFTKCSLFKGALKLNPTTVREMLQNCSENQFFGSWVLNRNFYLCSLFPSEFDRLI